MDGAQPVDHPEGFAELKRNVLGLPGVQQAVPEQVVQAVALNILLQNQELSVLFRHLINARQMRAADRHQPAVDRGIPRKFARNKKASALLMPQQGNPPVLGLAKGFYGYEALCQFFLKIIVKAVFFHFSLC